MGLIETQSGRRFEIETDMHEVTSLNRPDEAWSHTDPQGHEHYWTFNGQRGHYRPDAEADLPTLRYVVTGIGYYPDGETYEIGHHECRQCRAVVEPRSKADDTRQYVPGLKYYLIDGVSVSEAEFLDALEAEPDWSEEVRKMREGGVD